MMQVRERGAHAPAEFQRVRLRQRTRARQLLLKRVAFEKFRHEIGTALGSVVNLNEPQDARMIELASDLGLAHVLAGSQIARRHFHYHRPACRCVDRFERGTPTALPNELDELKAVVEEVAAREVGRRLGQMDATDTTISRFP